MHDESVLRTIELVQAQIADLELQTAEKRRMVNSLCGLIGRPAVYAITDPTPGASVGIRGDEFYGKPLASAVRSILEKRQAAGLGAATLDDIYAAMQQGAFQFDAKNDGTAKRSLAISLAKNTSTFHKLPNGTIGLAEWYPEAKPRNGKEKEEKEAAKQEDKEGKAEHDEDGPYPNDFAEAEPEKKVRTFKVRYRTTAGGTHTEDGPDGKEHTYRPGDVFLTKANLAKRWPEKFENAEEDAAIGREVK